MTIKGLAYTPFTLLAASIMVTMAFGTVLQIQTQPVSPQYQQTVEETWENTQNRYALDSLNTFIQVYSGDKTRQEVNQALKNLTEKGTYNSNQERVSTYKNWTKEVTKQSNNLENTELYSLSIDITNLSINSKAKLQTQTLEVSKTSEVSDSLKIRGVNDPLLDNTSYSRDINYCGFETLANKIYKSSEVAGSSGTVRGIALFEPESISTISSKDSKIIVTKDITNYSNSTTQDFAGYFSQNEPSSPSDYNQNYTAGTSSTPSIQKNQRVIIKNGFWKSYFYKAIPENCYMPTSLQEAPSIYDRINESKRGNTNQGIYTVLEPSPNQLDIGYERLDNSSLNPVGIETISSASAWSDYRMSESLAKESDLNELIK